MNNEDTWYLVKPIGATEPFEAFLVRVWGCDTFAHTYVYERMSASGWNSSIDDVAERSDFASDREESFSLRKKWDGCIDW